MKDFFWMVGCIIMAALIVVVIILSRQGKMPDFGPHPTPTQTFEVNAPTTT